ncbi:hypothetical protein ACFOJ6_12640 [Gordonia humi]|uniref:hypothetical protein n=1 Tax=Gordonia humi TaxID=686429 RepID=UPI003620BAB2
MPDLPADPTRSRTQTRQDQSDQDPPLVTGAHGLGRGVGAVRLLSRGQHYRTRGRDPRTPRGAERRVVAGPRQGRHATSLVHQGGRRRGRSFLGVEATYQRGERPQFVDGTVLPGSVHSPYPPVGSRDRDRDRE